VVVGYRRPEEALDLRPVVDGYDALRADDEARDVPVRRDTGDVAAGERLGVGLEELAYVTFLDGRRRASWEEVVAAGTRLGKAAAPGWVERCLASGGRPEP